MLPIGNHSSENKNGIKSMNSNKVYTNRIQSPAECLTKAISKDIGDEAECGSECSCDERSIISTQKGLTDTVWKAGCYKINPTTKSGSYLDVLCIKMKNIYILLKHEY